MLLLATLGALSVTGCIVAEAPDYGAPRRTTPVIGSVFPSPFYQVDVKNNDGQDFDITIFSEDAGENVVGVVYLDYGTPTEKVITTVEVFPRAADEPKFMSFTFTPEADVPVPKGCHALTLFVMHRNNYDLNTQFYRSDRDVATVTWWLDANHDAPGAPIECPKVGPT